jgi:hypothetical protein
MRSLAGLAVIVALAGAAPLANAQARPIELGIDGALSIGLEEPRVTVVAIPFQQFRVGFFMSPRTSIEPTLSINHISVQDVDLTTISLGVGVLFHTHGDRTRSQIYFRPFAGFTSLSGDAGSESGANLGLGVGLKAPFASRLASRFEAFLAHDFDAEASSIGILFGLSFFTR